ncbi:DUF1801 domain-containing protein [Halocola ammonii]
MTFHIQTDPKVNKVFSNYPDFVREQMSFLKDLIISTARETKGVEELEITLKWGEPSFVTKHGSTLRMDWKEKSPDHYFLFFQCNSRLVDTFRLVFDDSLQFEGKRAIVLHLDQKLPVEELRQCIKAALTYHQVKHLQTLGI